jgi:hypothetical protein
LPVVTPAHRTNALPPTSSTLSIQVNTTSKLSLNTHGRTIYIGHGRARAHHIPIVPHNLVDVWNCGWRICIAGSGGVSAKLSCMGH